MDSRRLSALWTLFKSVLISKDKREDEERAEKRQYRANFSEFEPDFMIVEVKKKAVEQLELEKPAEKPTEKKQGKCVEEEPPYIPFDFFGVEDAERQYRQGRKSVEKFVSWNLMHKAQSWFFCDLADGNAERILISFGLIEGSFLVNYHQSKHSLHVVINRIVRKFYIRVERKVDGRWRFRLDNEHEFPNLLMLVRHYTKHKSWVMGCKLTKGVHKHKRSE